MSRPVVQLHTNEQWLELDPSIRPIILQNIKLKDRLYRFLLQKNMKAKDPNAEARWAPCNDCEQRGWVLHKPRYPGIHPSQLPHPCLLRIYKEMVGEVGQEKIEARTQMIFDLGHAVHRMFQNYGEAGAWGPIYKKEVEISADYQRLAEQLMLEGHADADNILVIDDIPNSPIYEVGLVHEYKSINTNGYEKLNAPKPEHKQQALIYSAALNRPIVVYLYLNKNDSSLKDFPVAFNPELWARIENKARILNDHFDRGVAPEGTTGYHCQQCAYAFECPAYRRDMARKGRA